MCRCYKQNPKHNTVSLDMHAKWKISHNQVFYYNISNAFSGYYKKFYSTEYQFDFLEKKESFRFLLYLLCLIELNEEFQQKVYHYTW